MKHVSVGDIILGNDLPLVIIAGPNTLESRSHAIDIASALAEIADKCRVPLIFKTSVDKANRTSLSGERGVGLLRGLPILAEVRDITGLPVLTDVHAPEQCAAAAHAVDVLQIPAFLCRQTDLLRAAGATGKPVLTKKGQFLAPADMQHVAAKIASSGNEQILLCERGTSFGYGELVVDMRSLPILAATEYPVVFDATHSVARPGGHGDRSGGAREFVPALARAAVAIGVAAVFLETHEDPDNSGTAEADTMLPLTMLPDLIDELLCFDSIAKAARR
jgi:2-dehydro-3-deoxyphosphooctonate aldolase (KDO 8-P synthase)